MRYASVILFTHVLNKFTSSMT